MDIVSLLLYTTAAVCFVLAAFGVAGRVNLLALGLLAGVLVSLIDTIERLN